MNSPAKSRPLRWAEITLDSLSDALAEHAEQAGTSVCLDLRADAYGFGVAVVAPLATQHGFSRAVLSDGTGHAGLDHDDADADASWVQRAHAHRAMTLCAQVVNSKQVPDGTEVSYGGRYRTAGSTHLALVSIGFADGVPRLDPIGGFVEARDTRLPVAGRIAMDQLIVDTGDAGLSLGETVTVWGGRVSLGEWATWSRRPLELLSAGLGSRVDTTIVELRS